MAELDPRHKEIKEAIVDYIQARGYPPTVREIATRVSYKSTSTIQNHLNKMIELGIIETDEGHGISRAIRVPGYKFIKE